MRFLSPLRYPGGKAKMTRQILPMLPERIEVWHEPFAGGAGLGLELLRQGRVERLILNDLNSDIYAFWCDVLYRSEDIIEFIQSVPVDVATWQRVYDRTYPDLPEGFRLLYLNRTANSGFLTGRPIGGLDQSGKYKIDCRFNRDDLSARVAWIAAHRDRIELRNVDALVGALDGDFVYFDPPYVKAGPSLYDTPQQNLHRQLVEVCRWSPTPWLLSYDDQPWVHEAYGWACITRVRHHHSVVNKGTRSELLISEPSRSHPSVTRDR